MTTGVCSLRQMWLRYEYTTVLDREVDPALFDF
jgi:hypothetical protein